MRDMSPAINNRMLLTLTAVTLASFVLSALLVKASTMTAIVAFCALVLCVTTFIKPEISLYILVFSMLLSPEFGQRTTQGSGVTLRVDDFLLVLIGLSWFAKSCLDQNTGLFRKTKLNGPIFVYLGICIFSTALGIINGNVPLQSGFFFVLKYLEYYVVYFMVVNHVRTRRQIVLLIVSMLATCFIVDILALAQIPSGQRLTAPFEGERGEPNTLGGYLVLMLALQLSLAVALKSIRLKFLLLITISISVIPLALSLSRGSYLAFLPMYMAVIFLSQKRLLLLSTLILALCAAPFIIPEKVVDRVMYTFTQKAQRGQEKIGAVRLDTSTSARIRSWMDGISASIKRPMFGYGVTGWEFVDTQLIKVLVETGFLGLSAFLYLLISIFREVFKIYRKSEDPFFKAVSAGLLAGFIGLIVHSLGANTFIIVRIMEPFWLLAGIVMVIPFLNGNQPTPRSASPAPQKSY